MMGDALWAEQTFGGAGDEGIVRLVEHVASPFDPRGALLNLEEDGQFRLRIGQGRDGAPAEPLPLLFTLVAEKVR